MKSRHYHQASKIESNHAIPFLTGFLTLFRICQEWERGLILRLGKFHRLRGPGLIIKLPLVEQLIKVDHNFTIKVNAVVFLRVIDPENAIIQVEDHQQAVSQYSQSSLRSIIGQSELDDILVHRDNINQRLQKIIDEATEAWGVKVTAVEIKDVELPNSTLKSFTRSVQTSGKTRPAAHVSTS